MSYYYHIRVVDIIVLDLKDSNNNDIVVRAVLKEIGHRIEYSATENSDILN